MQTCALKRRHRGVTLLEVMLAAAIFAMIIGSVLLTMTASDVSWRTGQYKLHEQQEGRRVMDNLVRQIRRTKAEWVTIAPSSWPNRDQIEFYQPEYNLTLCGAGTLPCQGLKVTIKPDAADQRRLLMQQGVSGSWETIAQEIEGIDYGAGCAGCASYTCSQPAADCPVIRLTVTSSKAAGFNLTSFVTLRNSNTAGSTGTAAYTGSAGSN